MPFWPPGPELSAVIGPPAFYPPHLIKNTSVKRPGSDCDRRGHPGNHHNPSSREIDDAELAVVASSPTS